MNYLHEYYMDTRMHDENNVEYRKEMETILNSGMNVILFHHNDNDGTLAATTIARWIDTSVDELHSDINIIYIECNHTIGKRWKDFLVYIPVREENYIFGVDLSLSNLDLFGPDASLLDKLNKLCFLWSDHHLDTKEIVEMKSEAVKFPIYFREDMCGACLAYLSTDKYSFRYLLNFYWRDREMAMSEYIKSVDRTPKLYYLVDIRDRFLMNSKDWDTATGLYIISSKYSTKPAANTNFWAECIFDDQALRKYIGEGKSLLDFRNSIYRISFKATAVKVTGFNVDRHVYDFIAINAVGGSELFGKEDLKPEYDFCMVYNYTGKEYKYSIFTNKDCSKRGHKINLQEIAKSFGGGGHLHAAGFTSPNNLIEICNSKGMVTKL